MNFKRIARIAVVGITSNKLRSFLTALGITIGTASIFAILAIGQGMQENIKKKIEEMGTNVIVVNGLAVKKWGWFGSATNLFREDAQALVNEIPTVAAAAPIVQGGGWSGTDVKHQNKSTKSSLVGTSHSFAEISKKKLIQGSFFTEQDVFSYNKVCVLGYDASEALFGEATPIGRTIKVSKISFEVVGLLERSTKVLFGGGDNMVYVPITAATRYIFKKKDISSINVQVINEDKIAEAREDVSLLLNVRHRTLPPKKPDITITTPDEMMGHSKDIITTVTYVLGVIASISLLVGGIGIMNIMMVSVVERTREIGIRKALGARYFDIMNQFLIEAVAISFLGGLIGITMGWFLSDFVGSSYGLPISFPVKGFFISVGFSCFVGIFFGIYPAQKAAKMDPVEALRYE